MVYAEIESQSLNTYEERGPGEFDTQEERRIEGIEKQAKTASNLTLVWMDVKNRDRSDGKESQNSKLLPLRNKRW